jgi:predicted PurR-regulated permease PerM
VDGDVQANGRPAPAPSRRFLLAILLLLLLLSAYVARPFLAALLFAVLFGYLLQRPQRWLEKRVRWKGAAAGILLLAVALAFVLPVTFVGMSLVDQARDAADAFESPEAAKRYVAQALVRLGVPNETAESLPDRAIEGGAGFVQGLLGQTLGALFDFFTGLIVFFFMLYYVLVDGPRFMAFLRENTPIDGKHRERLFLVAGERVRAIMLGAVLVSIIQGVAAAIGWWIFGFPNPIFWGFVMTILAVLPFAGPILIMAPAAVFALLQGDVFAGIGLLAWAAVVVGLVDNFARPFVVGRKSDVHPSIILVGTLGGLIVFGVSGFVLGPLIMGLVPPVLEAWHDATTGEEPTPDELPDPPAAPPPPA